MGIGMLIAVRFREESVFLQFLQNRKLTNASGFIPLKLSQVSEPVALLLPGNVQRNADDRCIDSSSSAALIFVLFGVPQIISVSA